MGRRFEFRSREIELDFAGVKTTVPGTTEFAHRIEEIGREMIAWSKDPANANDEEAARDFMLDILDELLGEDIVDKIEENMKLELYDCADMFAYITEEVKTYHNSRIEAHTKSREKPTPVPQGAQPMAMAAAENRATRRARSKRNRRRK